MENQNQNENQDHSKKNAFDVAKVEERLKNVKSLSDLEGPGGVFELMFKGTVERLLKAEQREHLGYDPYLKQDDGQKNSRNGYSKKKVKLENREIEIEIPRDREGSFEPQVIQKNQSVSPNLKNQILSMYARGMTVRDIQSHLKEMYYGTEVSPTFISKVTNEIMDTVREWQSRPLECVYAVVFMDAIFYKARHDSKVVNKAAYTCLGIDLEGNTDILGIWISESEGSHFWLNVLTELKERGLEDILIACVDGLKGFPEAIANQFPETQVQLCIVHQIRNSLKYIASKNQKEFMKDLKEVYKAPALEGAETALDQLEEKWGRQYPVVVSSWRNNWTHLSTFFGFPPAIRKIIYTTNIVENVHRQFRKVTKSKTIFPTDDSLRKMLYLASLGATTKMRKKRDWPEMIGALKLVFGERVSDNHSA
jgi:putative transposase